MADAAEENKNGEYEITWQKKPLGFSIVMDTSGKNAYVSSIQVAGNLKKGLKLAAQIIEINGEKVKDLKHSEILTKIKNASQPITLKFQPRSFANDNKSKDDVKNQYAPRILEFAEAPNECRHVNGKFELLKSQINGKPAWQRKDDEEDPILLWFWPKDEAVNKSLMARNLWMIGRRSKLNQQDAYACMNASKQEDMEAPTRTDVKWKVYKQNGGWQDCEIKIIQSAAGE